MNRALIIFIFQILCFSAEAVVYAPQTLPNPKEKNSADYVCNPDDIITVEDQTYLNILATRLEDSTMVELCIVAVADIGDMDAFDFCYELFQTWGVGKKDKDTGVLLFVAKQSHDVRIMTGGGIEGVLTDAVCNRIIQQDMIPLMKEGDLSGGLCRGALRIYELSTAGDAPQELLSAKSITNRGAYAKDEKGFDWIVAIIILAGLGIGVFLLLYLERTRCPKCHRRAMVISKKEVITRATLRSAGLGVATYTCAHCHHIMTKTYTIPREVPIIIGGGGFHGGLGGGGFHGGSFGGGGTFGGGAGGKF